MEGLLRLVLLTVTSTPWIPVYRISKFHGTLDFVGTTVAPLAIMNYLDGTVRMVMSSDLPPRGSEKGITCLVLPRLHLQTQECFAPNFSLAVDPASPWHTPSELVTRLSPAPASILSVLLSSFQGAQCLQQHLKQTQESCLLGETCRTSL